MSSILNLQGGGWSIHDYARSPNYFYFLGILLAPLGFCNYRNLQTYTEQ